MEEPQPQTPVQAGWGQIARSYLPQAILVLILAVGAYLRFAGLDWDEGTHLHPDERFLTLVATAMEPVSGPGEYFDTSASKLNPHNIGYGFFVYGTLPVFIVRYLAEWLGQTDYGEVHLVGRAASGVADMISILLVYAIGSRLYRRRVGLLAAAFSAVSVLLIQHAHFFVVDPMTNTFILACFYLSVRIKDEGGTGNYVLAGLFLGMAVASKISAAPLAAVIALAAGARYLRSPVEDQPAELTRAVQGLLLAAVTSLLAFRIFQPYAFSGPSFFGVRPNPQWLSNMSEIRRQTAGDVDFPPALQWADRSRVLYSLRDMLLWGMGLPLGLAAWGAWAWALMQLIRRQSWSQHLLPVAWSGGYFLWRSSGFTQNMRYQLPVYPTLALLAAWGLWHLWERAGNPEGSGRQPARIAVGLLGGGILLLTTSYAFGFHRIYREPVTRVAASRWIYRHVPAAVNLVLATPDGERLEPLAAPEPFEIVPGQAGILTFRVPRPVTATGVRLHSREALPPQSEGLRLTVDLFDEASGSEPMTAGAIEPQGSSDGRSVAIDLQSPVDLEPGATYRLELHLETSAEARLDGRPALVAETSQGTELLPVETPPGTLVLTPGKTRILAFSPESDGAIRAIRLPGLELIGAAPMEFEASLHLGGEEVELAKGSRLLGQPGTPAGPIEIPFAPNPSLVAGDNYRLELRVSIGGGLPLEGATIIHESSWDDPLPLRVDDYDIGGRYPSRNLELYWSDSEDSDDDGMPDKLVRIADALDDGDFLFISSNRQYGSIARVPSRYPLATAFYRALFKCQAPTPVWKCADSAQPGQLDSPLGYELVAVFDQNPTILGVEISDQGADESFTVYDHPQAMIFAKSPDFSRDRVIAILDDVDLSNLVQAPPNELRAGESASRALMLPPARWQRMLARGTWSDLFPMDSPLNRSPALAVIAWWLTIGLLGWIALPITRRAFPGLVAGGYGVARVVGVLLLAWLAWIAGSLAIPVERAALILITVAMLAVSAALAWWDREPLMEALRRHRNEIALLEALALAFFLLVLFIRLGNPDLWHPSKGGEKPMDLSYLTAVLKSPTFPPYDPWFARGYINYYYFGFLIVGVPIKLLGIDPAVAYNLVLPTLFALLGLAAYTAGYHLVANQEPAGDRTLPRIAGFSAAISLCLLGNLGTARMLWDSLQVVGGEAAGNLFSRTLAGVRGAVAVVLRGESLPIGLDAWYWEPSRAIPPGPGEPGPITEFPFFTFLYADLHAHMISLPLTVTSLVWSLSWLRSAAGRVARWGRGLFPLAVGGLIIGALRPTNTWDFPVYIILGAGAVLVAGWIQERRLSLQAVASGTLSAAVLVGLAFLLFQPYTSWYGQGYTQAQLWEGSKTGVGAYLTVYGLFLFVIGSWLAWETREWMAATPITFLSRLRPWFAYLGILGLALALGAVIVYGLGYRVILVVLPLSLWAGLLLLRRRLAVGKRAVLFLIGTGLALTMVVEVVVLRGDIGRMNTVFKFYLQVWTLLSLAGGAALAWIAGDLYRWSPNLRGLWQLGLVVLVFGAALYPVTATPAKIKDRMAAEAPPTLDGTQFMQYAERSELGQQFSLAEDYRAIHWLQAQVEGSPVIVEANIPEYRWGSRYTIYTGLPNVLGWNWHQRQQRVAAGADRVTERAIAVSDFYTTRSLESARQFLMRFDVDYVVVGAVERIYYGTVQPCLPNGSGGVTCDLGGRPIGMGDPLVDAEECTPLVPEAEDSPLACPTYGLDKFDQLVEAGDLEVAYETGATRIYRVRR